MVGVAVVTTPVLLIAAFLAHEPPFLTISGLVFIWLLAGVWYIAAARGALHNSSSIRSEGAAAADMDKTRAAWAACGITAVIAGIVMLAAEILGLSTRVSLFVWEILVILVVLVPTVAMLVLTTSLIRSRQLPNSSALLTTGLFIFAMFLLVPRFNAG